MYVMQWKAVRHLALSVQMRVAWIVMFLYSCLLIHGKLLLSAGILWQRMWTTFITKDGSCEIYWLRPGPLVVTVLKKLFIVTASGQFDGIMCLFSTVKVVPYSDHCSFSELWQFVTSVRPRCVRPIVRHFTGDRNTITLSRANMSIFDELLDPTPSVSVLVTFT